MEGGTGDILPISGRHMEFDLAVMRLFPYLVVAFAVLSIVYFFVCFSDSYTLGNLVYSICCSYTIGFMFLGIPTVVVDRRTVYDQWVILLVTLAMSTAVGSVFWAVFGVGDNSPNEFIAGFARVIMGIFGLQDFYSLSFLTVVFGTDVLLVAFTLASYGVLEVVTAYFGKNYHRILLSLTKPREGRLKKTSRRVFMVPDIIDVSEVTIDPDMKEGFDISLFKRVYIYIFICGTVIASYLFLNPVLLSSIPHIHMMLIVILLSLFVSAIVVPCSIVRSLGAEARSQARPYVLCKGLKAKLFHGGFYLMLFLTLLWVCVFMNVDLEHIFVSYVSYMFFMMLFSGLVSFIYVNSFYKELRDLIIYNFNKAKRRDRTQF